MSQESSQSLLQKGNDLFVDDLFQDALKKYDEAVQLDPKNEEILLKRSACQFKLDNFEKSLEDANKVLELNSKNEKGHLRVGMALFELGKFKEAKNHFDSCLSIDSNHSQAKTWSRKCGSELDSQSSYSSSKYASLPSNEAPSTETSTPTSSSTPVSSNSESKQTVAPSTTAEKPQFTQSGSLKIRHEWYQTASHVTVSILCKNAKQEDTRVSVKERSLSVELTLPTGAEYQLDLQLEGLVDPNNTKISFLSTRIEISMPKLKQVQWKNLEGSGDQTEYSNVPAPSTTTATKPKKNWDKILDEDKDEEQDINQVFQSIFSNGTDEQKRAMMKSFTESGGTVLSTNWNEVGSKTVKGSPPAGMEMHSWNQQ